MHTLQTHPKVDAFILKFFTTQPSWFSMVANAKMRFEKVCFEAPIISFFWDLPVFPCQVDDSIAN